MPGYKSLFCKLSIVGCLWSCGGERPGKGDILSINEMKQVMWNMIQVDEFAASYIGKDSTLDLKKETGKLYQKVFVLHKIDSAHFFKSFKYYKEHPDDYKILLDSLTAFGIRERENRFNNNRLNKVAQ